MIARKILGITLLGVALTTCGVAAYGDGYSTGDSQQVLDDAKARRLLGEVHGVDLKTVWFATGMENYYRSPSCITGRGIYFYTKPVQSSPGVYRGRLTYVEGSTSQDGHHCNELTNNIAFSVPVASFINPDDMHPDEAFDGSVPGLFHVDGKTSDEELKALAGEIETLHSCVKGDLKCPFALDLGGMMRQGTYWLTPALKVKNLLSIDVRGRYGSDKECYEAYFQEESPNFGAVEVTLCYRGAPVASVSITDEVLE